jgi:DNA-binding GntR family transcriptional regulator
MSEMNYNPIPPLVGSGGLVDQIRDSLFIAIISGSLEPGARLREIPLSKYLGVSTTPVREALRRLDAEGLVEVSPRRGAIVTALDAHQVADLYQLRIVLETAAGRMAALSGRPMDSVEGLIKQSGRYLDEEPQVTFHRLDVDLHRAIAELSGNKELARTVEHVHRQIQAVRIRCHVPGRLRVAHSQHEEIASAIRAGDPEAAEAALIRHIGSARDNVLDSLRATALLV